MIPEKIISKLLQGPLSDRPMLPVTQDTTKDGESLINCGTANKNYKYIGLHAYYCMFT
jgi:hypothetical protein